MYNCRQSDGGVFADGHKGDAVNNDLLCLPAARQISPSLEMHFPNIFTGVEAFP